MSRTLLLALAALGIIATGCGGRNNLSKASNAVLDAMESSRVRAVSTRQPCTLIIREITLDGTCGVRREFDGAFVQTPGHKLPLTLTYNARGTMRVTNSVGVLLPPDNLIIHISSLHDTREASACITASNLGLVSVGAFVGSECKAID